MTKAIDKDFYGTLKLQDMPKRENRSGHMIDEHVNVR